MLLKPGDIFNLKLELNIQSSKEISFDDDELKLFLNLFVRRFFDDPDFVKELGVDYGSKDNFL